MKRRRFTKEFKQEIVEMSYSTDKSLDQFAQDMGVGRSTLNTWRNQAKALGQNAFPGSGHQTPDHAELSRLKRELQQARMERDILKKALAFFAQASP
jgi:transposase